MYARDRAFNLALFIAAVSAWIALVLLVTSVYPDTLLVEGIGAALLGTAIGLTAAPLLWLAAFGIHRRIAYHGDWGRAARRGAWAGALAGLFVLLRELGAFSLPIALFVVAMALFVEVSLSVER
ncbi:MAG TPA: hypothetical protein VMH24_03295 [Candidatus Sulfotelmatobacter sp.]|nr:hypothetical protein [Candidatus Sulfotelmatobacter sp.]